MEAEHPASVRIKLVANLVKSEDDPASLARARSSLSTLAGCCANSVSTTTV
jgi:hypothetical protein